MPDRKPWLSGGCQCGAIRYAAYAEPQPATICHCRMCQRAVGGPFLASAAVGNRDFAWTKGAPATFQSSSKGLRDFCAACGTPLAFRFVGGTTVDFHLATLDDPTLIRPARQIGIESRLGWVGDLGSLPGQTTQENAGQAHVTSLTSFQRGDGVR